MDYKITGSYYTPEQLVSYMTNFVMEKGVYTNILEPSAGDGRFIKSLLRFKCTVEAVEIDKEKAQNLNRLFPSINISCIDFLQYETRNKEYDLVIGNPPYINKKMLSSEQKIIGKKLCEFWNIDESVLHNIWVPFVLKSMQLIKTNKGAIFFVLPQEFLMVNYAEKLRVFLESKFNYIEITTFEQSVFKDTEQDVCLVYLSNIENIEPIVKYTTFNNIDKFDCVFANEIKKNKPLKKWSNAILSDIELEIILELQNRYTRIGEMGKIVPGIVTGKNDYFILNAMKVKELNCQDNVLPIIQGNSIKNRVLILKKADFIKLKNENNQAFLLNLSEPNIDNKKLENYIKDGEKKKINEGYKCKKRKPWYSVPIVQKGDLLFFKRFDELPKLIINEASIYSTDVAYNIRLEDAYDSESIAFCFYNSLTLTLCEYYCRFYGGGVGELTPNEFKAICIPYRKIKKKYIHQLDLMFRNGERQDKIVSFVDSIVLKDMDSETIEILERIRSRFLMRRK